MNHVRNKMRGRWRLPVVGLAAMALVATGCAGDDEAVVDDTGVAEQTDIGEEDVAEDESPTDGESPAVEESPEEAVTDDQAAAGEQQFSTDLQALNDSGASGNVQISTTADGQLSVTLEANDVSANAPHAQHIHIGGENECPTPEADTDGDGLISTPEGQPAYGGIQVSLTTEGDVGAESGLAVERFPTADDTGTYTYERTFDLPSGVTVDDISNGVVVVHGLADSPLGEDPDAYDGPDSPLQEGVPQEATLPVLCGPLGGSA